jgi:predicted thioesterase
MKSSLKTGLSATRRITVDRERTIGFMGEAARVYATPRLVNDLEYACRDMLLEHLDPGEDSVGARVEIDHLAPTLIDMWVEIAVRIVELEGRRVTFEVTARDSIEKIGRGRHTRFIVDKAKTEQRIAAKAAKVKAAKP